MELRLIIFKKKSLEDKRETYTSKSLIFKYLKLESAYFLLRFLFIFFIRMKESLELTFIYYTSNLCTQ